MSIADSFRSLSANKSTSSNWKSTGGTMTNAVTGTFTIGGRGNNRNFDGKIASMVVTTLLANSTMPTDANIKDMIVDPVKWTNDKIGGQFRVPYQSSAQSDFQRATSGGYSATQVWLMGDGAYDSYTGPANIRNDVRDYFQSYT